MLPFRQVDVFSRERLLGNPVAVVHDAGELTDAELATFARWTNLSETTFLLTPTVPTADYRLRIFTPGGELPFAGHPTIGSAHAWLEAGGVPRGEYVVQECAAGLVPLRRLAADPAGGTQPASPPGGTTPVPGGVSRLAFAAPPLLRDGPVDDDLLARLTAPLGIEPADVVDAKWCDNGPGWVGLRLASARQVLALAPDFAAIEQDTGVVGPYPEGGECAVEVRAFCAPHLGITEDPVTGSLNASLGQWLAGDVLPTSYVASQGTALGRRGRVHVEKAEDGTIWVGGDAHTTIAGTVRI
ncbi:PhzF family phenazine biosynthesis protein [Pseudofrankia sp. DC12]|uniref:PhzF family phenazine biosynthesis protein n=1 Tax=Pseudofrankia sp. DC12 TaxID=683315 RepID=UPI0005F7994E|nr:PhzF family phenazine biosynthesis protein [Pseudofrankia sp. DC12]